MRVVEHTVYLFLIFSKTPIVRQIISAHRVIYNIFCSGIYHNPYSIFKSKSQDFHNKNIGLFGRNDTIIARYLMGMNRDLRMRKVPKSTIFYAEFNIVPKNNKLTKLVRYIHDNRLCER